ncbi:M28 family peptidase [Paractinoplanes lichenicola]|uniref:Vacuolar membrane protease n=1 Tax=Paractinoplanes lichenicola TaxID=2802976 RepID=A0ABS1VR05_9ACTN|nr:M28 family peptidase [Actinoplanes lichenicola]MBL7257156.1 M28 family peptidase [Actinoplanes lichenicola]
MRAPAITDPAHRALAAVVAVVVLILAGAAGLATIRPPSARPVSAPEAEFSAERAFQQVQAIAQRPHPVGSPANDEVREHLLTTLRGLGLTPEVQDTVSIEGAGLSASAGGAGLARVRNVIARIPGTGSTGRVFLVAHYDSVQVGPGGNDDAAGTSTILETARALLAGPRLRNDVVLVLTDGEEACLCGAKAFVDQHPLARDGGVVLNIEARGSSGPAIMFETSAGNGGLVGAYAHAPKPVGTSFAVEIYRLLPNDTDFTPFRESGFAGMNAAYIDGAAVYHAPTDVPAAMNRASLQHHGDNTLAVTRELGGRDLAPLAATDGGDATYFPVPGLLVRYPGALVWPIALLALVAVAALAWLARRRRLTGGRRLLKAGALALVPIVVAPLLAQLLWFVLTKIRPPYAQLPIDPYRPGLYRVAVILLSAAVVLAWFALLRRRLGPAALAIAGLGWLAVLGIVLAAFVPGGSYLAAIPALVGALTCLFAVGLSNKTLPVVAVTLGGAVATVILLPTVIMLFPALGMGLGAAGAFLTVLLGLALLPVIDLIHPRAGGQRGLEALRSRRLGALPALAAAVAALVCTVTGLAVDRFDAERPALTQLMYALDADNGTARWISDEPRVQQWTSQFVQGEPHRVDDTLPSFGPEQVRTGDAPAAGLPAPLLTVESDTRTGETRTLKVRLKPQRQARLITLHVAAATPVESATVGGRPMPAREPIDGAWGWGFVFHAPPADGVEVTLTVRTAGEVKFRAMDGSDGLSQLPGFKSRPAAVGIVGSHTSELLAVAKTYTF